MKYLILFFLFSQNAFTAYSKPELLARLSDADAWNAPSNMWCFSSEPMAVKNLVYMSCFDGESHLMAQWGKNSFKVVARAQENQIFSSATLSFGNITWSEYSEYHIQRSFELGANLVVTDIKNIDQVAFGSDTFLPIGKGEWLFRAKSETPEVFIWKKGEARPFFNPGAAFIFSPQVSATGEIALKTRDGNYNESSPDRLWLYQGEWKVILEDQDANPKSPWKSFRHQLNVDKGQVLLVARDQEGEALIVAQENSFKVIARAGKDLKAFDYFTPKMRGETISFRGEDFDGKKVVYVYDQAGLRKLLTQGDIVLTDKGPAKVQYQNRDSIFYGAPGIDEQGNIYQQATLTDPDFPSTLLGIGLIKFQN